LWILLDQTSVENGYIRLSDFKPNAAKEKYARLEPFLYALALSLRTGIWLRNFLCGWFGEKDCFEFRSADVVLKVEKVDRSEMRKYIRQF